MSQFSLKSGFQKLSKAIALLPLSRKATDRVDLFSNLLLYTNNPTWLQTKTIQDYFNIFWSNPVLFSTLMIKAKAYANVKVQVKNKKTQEIEPFSTTKRIPKKVYDLFAKPNPLQATREFLIHKSIFFDVAGNSYLYANVPDGFNVNIETVQTLVNVWPQYMTYKLAGAYFDALTIEDIIQKWIFYSSTFTRTFEPSEILHQNYPNVDFKNSPLNQRTDAITSNSPVFTLTKPLSNIDMAYEGRNVMIKNRGMRAIMSSDQGDATGKIPIHADDAKNLQKRIEEYGFLNEQKQFWFTRYPIKATVIDQDVRKLGLFEEIVDDTRIVCNAYQVPVDLVKMDLKGITYENQTASLKRLYEDSVIPQADEDFSAINAWLGMNDTEWQIIGTFDHLAIFQEDKEKSAKANQAKSSYLERLFMNGAITHNTWLSELDLPTYPEGDRRIFEFSEDELEIILNREIEDEPENETTT